MRIHTLSGFGRTAALSLSLALVTAALTPAAAARQAQPASADDTARYLAGMPLPEASPLAPATKSKVWERHKKRLDAAWAKVERSQLSKIRKWSAANITDPQSTLFYPFSGPDFLYADAFFPKATTYVLAGLEPVGREPDLVDMRAWQRDGGIQALESSINTVLRLSFFRTQEMHKKFRQRAFPGVIPVLYTFLVRSGKTIESSELLVLGSDGLPRAAGEKETADGVRINFTAPGAADKKVLYYFSTNIANDGLQKSGFLNFLKTLAPGDSFIKSASYLPHRAHFSELREFLLANSRHLVQDDTGIPLTFFDKATWDRQPHGNYNGPISIFSKYYQPAMRKLFGSKERKPIDFGIGYRWRPSDSGLLLAVKK